MHRIFISHSSSDNAKAAALRNWLYAEGYHNQVFLDFDPRNGLRAGEKWRDALLRAAGQCEAVLCLVSNAWIASRECQRELNQAEAFGKSIIPLILEPISELPADISKWQYRAFYSDDNTDQTRLAPDIASPNAADVSFPTSSLAWLQKEIRRAALESSEFAFDMTRPIFPGFSPFDLEDAAIFFGRTERIRDVIDLIRRRHGGQENRGLLILGGSGAGKSSFLRAGILARLRRDQNFLVLRPMRAAYGAIRGTDGLHSALADIARLTDVKFEASSIASRASTAPSLNELLDEVVARHCRSRELTPDAVRLVISIDQGEEWFTQEGTSQEEARACLNLLADLTTMRNDILLVAAVRSDASEQLAASAPMAHIKVDSAILRPIETASLVGIVRGPVEVARGHGRDIRFSDDLIEELVRSAQGADVVPMLAFTLERLLRDAPSNGEITQRDYAKLQIEVGIIDGAVERALARCHIPLLPDAAGPRLRELFVPALCMLEPTSRARLRRQCFEQEIAPTNLPLANALVEERLLTKNVVANAAGQATPSYEIAHEAVLRQWKALDGWLEEEGETLLDLSRLKRAAEEWRVEANTDEREDFLIHSGRALQNAEALIASTDSNTRYSRLVGVAERAYLTECRRKSDGQRLDRDSRVVELRRQLYRTRQPDIRAGIFASDPEAVFRSVAQLLVDFDSVDISDFPFVERSMNTACMELKVATVPNGKMHASRLERLKSGVRGARILCHYGDEECAAVGTDANVVVVDHYDLPAPVILALHSNPISKRARDAFSFDVDAAPLNGVEAAHWNEVYAIAVDAKRKRFFLIDGVGVLRRMDLAGVTHRTADLGHCAISLSPSGDYLLAISEREARVVDPETLEAGAPLISFTREFGRKIQWSPSGRFLAITESSNEEGVTQQTIYEALHVPIVGLCDPVLENIRGESLRFSPCDRFVLAMEGSKVRMWGVLEQRILLQKNDVLSAAFSPDGSSCALLCDDNTLRIWDLDHLGQPSRVVQLGLNTSTHAHRPRNRRTGGVNPFEDDYDEDSSRERRKSGRLWKIHSWGRDFVVLDRGSYLERWPISFTTLSGVAAVSHWIAALETLPGNYAVVHPEQRVALQRLVDNRCDAATLLAARQRLSSNAATDLHAPEYATTEIQLNGWRSKTELANLAFDACVPLGKLRRVFGNDRAELADWLGRSVKRLAVWRVRSSANQESLDQEDVDDSGRDEQSTGKPAWLTAASASIRFFSAVGSAVLLTIRWPVVQMVRAIAEAGTGLLRFTFALALVVLPLGTLLVAARLLYPEGTAQFFDNTVRVFDTLGNGFRVVFIGKERAQIEDAASHCQTRMSGTHDLPSFDWAAEASGSAEFGESGIILRGFSAAIGPSASRDEVVARLGAPCDAELGLWRVSSPDFNDGDPIIVAQPRFLTTLSADRTLVLAARDATCNACVSGYLFVGEYRAGARPTISFLLNRQKSASPGQLLTPRTQSGTGLYLWQPATDIKGGRKTTTAEVSRLDTFGIQNLGEVPIASFPENCGFDCRHDGYELTEASYSPTDGDMLSMRWIWRGPDNMGSSGVPGVGYDVFDAAFSIQSGAYAITSGTLPSAVRPTSMGSAPS